MSKKCFNVIVYDTFENLATYWKKETGLKFLMLCLSLFKYRYVSFFHSSGNIPQFKQFLNIEKRGLIIASPENVDDVFDIKRNIRKVFLHYLSF